MAITDGDGVYGIPYAVEGYGIIYNDAIMKKYFALPDKAVDISVQLHLLPAKIGVGRLIL